jgi:Zn-dependent protease/CBS domain-containing protein
LGGTGTFKVGRVLGFEINLHWSWSLIFILVTWTVAEGLLKDAYPDWDGLQRWLIGAVVSIIFFLSILFHEVSHSVVARGYGLPVGGITLFVFGGVSSLTKEPANAKQEFWVAIVGPLTSLVIAAAFGIAYFVLHSLDSSAAVVAKYLALVNLAIGVFNLVPGFPLDGGRVLRAIFWWRNRSLLDATKIASRAGQGASYAIMGAGVVLIFMDLVLLGIWFLLIGNFLRGSSAASYEQLFIETVLRGVPASRLARRDFVAVSPDMKVSELIEQHVLSGAGRCYPVMAGEELLGLVTLTDARKIPREQWPETSVYRTMTPLAQLKTVGPRDGLEDVLKLMAANDINQVPLLDGRILSGLIHRSDVIRYIQVREEIGPDAAAGQASSSSSSA